MRRRLAAAVLLAAAVAGAVVALGGGPGRDDSYRVDVVFDHARGLIPGQLVEIAGGRVGKIADVSLTPDFKARVSMTVDPRFAPFHRDASCTIRPQGLIAENYVQCVPGTAAAPELRGTGGEPPTVPVEHTSEPVNLTDLFEIWNVPTRDRLSVLLSQLGVATAGRGEDLNAILRRANPALAQARRVIGVLERQRADVLGAIDESDTALAALAPHAPGARRLLRTAASVLTRTGQRSADLSLAVRRLPALLRGARPALASLGDLAASGTPLLAQVHRAAPAVLRLTRDAPALARAARPTLAKVGARARARRADRQAGAAGRPRAARLRAPVAAVGQARRPAAAQPVAARVRRQPDALLLLRDAGDGALRRDLAHPARAHRVVAVLELRDGAHAGVQRQLRPVRGRPLVRPAPGLPPRMTRRPDSRLRRLLDNTLVVGVAILAVAAIALVVSYRAQDGLPFASVYHVNVDVPDAAKLLKNADVRIGGARVGQILALDAEPGSGGGPPFTRLRLALDPGVGPLPADTTSEVRLASVLGGKFLDLVPGHRGTGAPTIPDGGVLPLARARPGIDIDEALLVFGPGSRAAIRGFIGELGDGVAARGASVNEALAAAARSLPAARRVLTTVLAPGTDLAGFLRGAASASAALAPVAPALGRVVDDAATTFAALDAAGPALDTLLTGLPGAEAAATEAVTALRPVLDDAAAITRSLAPAGAVLGPTLRSVDATVRTATPITRRVGGLAAPVDAALRAVDRFARSRAALGAIEALKGEDLATFGGSAFLGLGAILRTVSQAQLHCNAAALWVRNLASIASEGDAGGNWLRMIPVFEQNQISHSATPDDQLHANYYPHENARECEAGNEPYAPGQALGNPPGHQPTHVEVTGRAEGSR